MLSTLSHPTQDRAGKKTEHSLRMGYTGPLAKDAEGRCIASARSNVTVTVDGFLTDRIHSHSHERTGTSGDPEVQRGL